MFSHRQASAVSAFITLSVATGAKITASPGHYIWVISKSTPGALQPARAQDIMVGDCLVATNDAGQSAAPACVVRKAHSMERGLYNPHVASGSIVVNSIAALTFTDTLPPSLAVHRVVTVPGHLLYLALKAVGGPAAADVVNNALLALYFSALRFSWLAVVSSK